MDMGSHELATWSYRRNDIWIRPNCRIERRLQLPTARGFTTTVESPKGSKLSLLKHGERAYDHVLLLPAKSKGLGPALTANNLLEFMKHEGNIMVALSSEQATPTAIAAMLLELDISIPADKGALV